MKVYLLLLVVFLVACTQITFEQGFNKILELDQKYNASFYTEELNKTVVSFENIEPFLQDLNQLEKQTNAKESSESRNTVLNLIQVRKLMLVSEKNWHISNSLRGTYSIYQYWGCSDKESILNRTYYINRSYIRGTEAMRGLDQIYTSDAEARNIVKRPNFYDSPFSWLRKEVDLTNEAIEKYCG